MRSWTREEKKQIVSDYRNAKRGSKHFVTSAHKIHRSYIYRWEASEASLVAVERIRMMSETVSPVDHPLLQPRQPKPGQYRYIYSWDDVVEMIRETWVPAATGAEKGQVSEKIQALVGAKRFFEILKAEFATKEAAPAPTTAPVQPKPQPRRSHGHTCRYCGGPVADSSGNCGECR